MRRLCWSGAAVLAATKYGLIYAANRGGDSRSGAWVRPGGRARYPVIVRMTDAFSTGRVWAAAPATARYDLRDLRRRSRFRFPQRVRARKRRLHEPCWGRLKSTEATNRGHGLRQPGDNRNLAAANSTCVHWQASV